MPTDPNPADDTAPAPRMPTSARVAVITMAALAVLLLSNAALLWYGFDAAVDRIVREGADFSRAEARQLVTASLIPTVVLGLLFAVAAVFVPRRRPWARWIGLVTSGLLALLTLFQVLAAGGITVSSLLVLVLSVAAVTSLMARTTGAWMPPLRSRA